MRRTATVLLLASVTLPLAACGGGDKPSAAGSTTSSAAQTTSIGSSPSSVAPSTPTAVPSRTNSIGVSLNTHGNIPKQIGQLGGVVDTSGGPDLVDFTVTGIRVDPTCDAPSASKPLNGHFIAVDITVTTSAALTDAVFFAEKDFSIIGTDGVTDTNVAGYGFTCLRNRFTDDQLGAGQTYKGSIVLDAAETSGSLTLQLPEYPGNGWEWQFQS